MRLESTLREVGGRIKVDNQISVIISLFVYDVPTSKFSLGPFLFANKFNYPQTLAIVVVALLLR